MISLVASVSQYIVAASYSTDSILVANLVSFLVLGLPIILIVAVVAKIVQLSKRRQRLSSSVVVTQYDPPNGLSPAELGYLLDARLSKEELLATVVSLEQRGLLEITDGSEYRLNAKRSDNFVEDVNLKLTPYEQYLYELAAGGSHNLFQPIYFRKFRKHLHQSLIQQEYIKSGVSVFVISFFIIIGVINLWLLSFDDVSFAGFLVFNLVFGAVFAPLFIGLAAAISFVFKRIAGWPGFKTAKLRQLWPEIEGYKHFIEVVELDELAFESEHLKTKTRNHVHAYAIALGLDTKWYSRFNTKHNT